MSSTMGTRVRTSLGVLAVVSASLTGSVAGAEDQLTPLLAALAEPKLGPSCAVLREGKLAHANLEITLGQGTACPVSIGETKVGWFFVGAAKFRYLSRDRIEYPVLRYNAKTEGQVDVEDVDGGLVAITGAVRTVYFVASSGAVPALTGDPGGTLPDAFQKHRQAFMRYGGRPTAHVVGAAMLDRAPSAAVRVELDGGAGPLVYTFEPTDDRSESLEILGTYATDDRERRKELRATTLSRQPIARDRRVPVPPAFLMTAVDYELTASGGNDVTITARTTVIPTRDGLRVLAFDVPGTILVRSGPGDSSTRTYRIASAVDGAGNQLSFARQNRSLLIDLGRPSPKGRPVEIVFRIDGDFLVRPSGDNYWILEAEEIFPQPPFAGRQYTTHGLIRVKKPFTAIASGTTVRRAEEGEDNVLEVRSELPTLLTAVIAGKYELNELSREGLTVRVATYAGKNARSQTQLSELAFGMVKYLERFLGPFPVPELNIVQVNDLGWGQAPLGMMLITNEAFDRMLPPEFAHFYTEGVNERFAHEIAHQWWGHAIRWPNAEETWLSEAFAEYSAGLMVKRAQGKGVFDNLKATWKSRGKAASRVAPIALANQISNKDAATRFEFRFGLLYAKGPWLLSRLNDELGDETFLKFLKSYQKSLRGKPGSTKLAAELLQVVTGKDYGPFFDANYWGTAMPN